jgi:lipoprotein-anchoring transpeptidase ErfK/SrfK
MAHSRKTFICRALGVLVALVLPFLLAEAPAGAADEATVGSTGPQRIAPPSRQGATVARIVAPSRARQRLKSPKPFRVVGPQTSWARSPQVLLVLRSANYRGRQWLKVRLASRPNLSSGWIARDRVTLARTNFWITIKLRRRLVRVFRKGRLVRQFRSVIGAPSTPTPRGLGAIYEKNRQTDKDGFIGPWALPLTFMSNVLESYGGGPGRVAIHGRGGASYQDPLGSARSHGCVRVPNRHVQWLARKVPVGTPVRILAGN